MRSPAPSGRPRLRTSHHADRVLVAAAFAGAGSVGPTPGIAPRRVQAPLGTLVARAPDAVRPQHVAAACEPVPSTRRAVVKPPRELRALAALTQAEPGRPGPDDRPSGGAAGQAQTEVKRLESISQLDLVPLGAAQELDAPHTVMGHGLQRVERVDQSR